MYIFKHSLFRLKITVGCLTNTYPSIHVEDTLKITVACGAHIRAFTFLLTKTLSRSRSVARCAHIQAFAKTLKITVGCLVCGVVCVARVVCRVLCVCMWCVCVHVVCVCACVVVARVCGVW